MVKTIAQQLLKQFMDQIFALQINRKNSDTCWFKGLV